MSRAHLCKANIFFGEELKGGRRGKRTVPVGVRGEEGMGYEAKIVGFGVVSVVGDCGRGTVGQNVGDGRGAEKELYTHRYIIQNSKVKQSERMRTEREEREERERKKLFSCQEFEWRDFA
jgi:hypothetical protein